MTTTITLEPLWHNKKQYIAIKFKYNDAVKEYVRAYQNVKWSKTYKTFYTLHHKERIHELFTYFRKPGYYVNYNAFKSFQEPPKATIS